MQDKYNPSTFPTLKVQELIEFYREERSLEMRLDQFTNPTAEVWYNNYLFIVSKVLDMTLTELEHKHTILPKPLDYLYEGCLNTRLAFLVKRMLIETGSTGLSSFNLMDIGRPNKKRSSHCLSSFLNFMRFQDMQGQNYEEIIMNEKADLDENGIQNEKIRILEEKKSKDQSKQMEAENTSNLMRNEAQRLSLSLKWDVEKLYGIKELSTDLEGKFKELGAVLARKQEQSKHLDGRLERAVSHIVPSPMRLQKDIQNSKEKLPHLEEEIENLMVEMRDLKEQAKKMKEGYEDAVSLKEKTSYFLAINCEMKEIKQMISRQKLEAKEVSAGCENLKLKIADLQCEIMKKREELLKSMEAQSKQLTSLDEQINCCTLEVEQLTAMIVAETKMSPILTGAMEKITKGMSHESVLADDALNSIQKSVDEFDEKFVQEILNKTYEDVEKKVQRSGLWHL